MRILTIMSDITSPPGTLADYLPAAGATLETIMPYQGSDKLPTSSADYDGLLMFGGVMCADAEDEHPFLAEVLPLIRDFGDQDKPVLGFCLGSQMIARAYGGALRRDGAREFGFVRHSYRETALDDPLLGPEISDKGRDHTQHIMHWHNDTFELPPKAIHLMESETCKHQAFRIEDTNVWGFQFHMEVNADIVEKWTEMRADIDDLHGTGFHEDIARQTDQHLDNQKAFAQRVCTRWLTHF